MSQHTQGPRYTVQVWFAIGSGFSTVGSSFPTIEMAEKEARAYLSDSRGVRVVDAKGRTIRTLKEGK